MGRRREQIVEEVLERTGLRLFRHLDVLVDVVHQVVHLRESVRHDGQQLAVEIGLTNGRRERDREVRALDRVGERLLDLGVAAAGLELDEFVDQTHDGVVQVRDGVAEQHVEQLLTIIDTVVEQVDAHGERSGRELLPEVLVHGACPICEPQPRPIASSVEC